MASTLEDAWHAGKQGCLSPLEQSKAWALREVYRELKTPEKKLYTKVAKKLTKVGGGKPTSRAVLKLFAKVDNDDDWHPGKAEEGRGRKPALSGVARNAIKRSAEATKKNGGEPTFNRIMGTCLGAVVNPATDKPVDKKRVYDVFRDDCYDDGADQPWKHRKRLTKTALPEDVIKQRLQWGRFMQGLGHTAEWYYKNVIWFDLCNSIIPTSEKKADQMALARKSGSGWMSPGFQEFSRNLKGKPETLKQKSWNTYKLWWMPVLVRGKLHVECFGLDFPGENSAGAQQAAEKLGPILNKRFPNESKPKIVMSDRGVGFYHGSWGTITHGYKAGLQSSGLRPLMGEDASKQPGSLSDLLLHETAVAWLRYKMKLSIPARPWKETSEQYKARIQEACRKVNAEYNVEGLCKQLPERLDKLKEKKGDRLKK